jgi:hypothetical protein
LKYKFLNIPHFPKFGSIIIIISTPVYQHPISKFCTPYHPHSAIQHSILAYHIYHFIHKFVIPLIDPPPPPQGNLQ